MIGGGNVMFDIWKCDNPIHENKLWLTKYLYSIADPNTKEGAQWHRKLAIRLFATLGILVVASFVVFKILL